MSGAGGAKQIEPVSAPWGSRVSRLPMQGLIVAFPGPREAVGRRAVDGFNMRDRIAALAWVERARAIGFTRLVFEEAGRTIEEDFGPFIMIYESCASWASWGVGCAGRGYTLWRSACGTTMGVYESLSAALDALAAFKTQGVRLRA